MLKMNEDDKQRVIALTQRLWTMLTAEDVSAAIVWCAGLNLIGNLAAVIVKGKDGIKLMNGFMKNLPVKYRVNSSKWTN